jgi:TonB family protein
VSAGDESAEKTADSVTAVFNSIIEADRTPPAEPSPPIPAAGDAGDRVAARVVPAAAEAVPAVSRTSGRRRSRSGPLIALVAALLVVAVAGLMTAIWVRSPLLAGMWSLARGSDVPATTNPAEPVPPPSTPAPAAPAVPGSEVPAPVTAAPAPAATTAVETTGMLRIVTQPAGAAITLDGEARGESPVRVDRLPLGRHSISASLAGHAVARQNVELTPEVRARVITLTLAPVEAAMGVVSVSSSPAGAAVSLDGRSVGTTPTRLDVSAGRHVLRVEQQGYAPQTREIDVVAGRSDAIDLTLEPAPVAAAGPVTYEQADVKPRQSGGSQNPEYPAVARLARQSGTVVLTWVVDERGGVTDIDVVQSTSKVFENAVLGWIRGVKFEPGQEAGRPVPVRMTRRFRFELAQ